MRPPRRHLLSVLTLAIASWGTTAHAQSLQELYDAARSYDASYLASRALAQSAEFKAAQADALGLPSASLAAKGYRPLYLSARPEWLTERTHAFLAFHGFPKLALALSSGTTPRGQDRTPRPVPALHSERFVADTI